MVNDKRAHTGNACVRICTPRSVAVSRYTAELQDRASLQAQSAIQFWLDRESSYKRLSQLALDHVASPASQTYMLNDYSRCVVIRQQENGTELGCL